MPLFRLKSLAPLCLATLLAACVIPIGDPRIWGEVEVRGETYQIVSQRFREPGDGPFESFLLYFVRVDGIDYACGAPREATEAQVTEACERRARRVLAAIARAERHDDDDDSYTPPDGGGGDGGGGGSDGGVELPD